MPTVAVEGYDAEVEALPGEAILGALCRRGYSFKFGCRRGGCGVCKVHLVSGQVTYPKTVAESVLPEGDRAGGVCLTCRAVPVTDVVIRLGDDDQLRRAGIFRLAGGIRSAAGLQSKGTTVE
ncbi:2Fe-2S iron-sulfur cluster binding domain-containing protein [Mycolicibacterium sp. CH28]|uniref:2Fe-2S iron-sulfur cluster-binding protein n=1 Tax=Mycolicibacterium sp. CH28 TaxID=2512237 RepID=UPI001081A467|nr:2Fe-2S iron-sulfur cluster-binding protein [Mycolicibacterium sp. CH28]TGD86037.1 2Fe-2S iron-sulfur cluster binding domain-containing protein [Mycolicibacterium sp. CH28]